MKAVIFDVDGVIVDVRESYHQAIKKTAEHFLGKEVPLELIREIKFSKGINNDWDLTYEILRQEGKEVDYNELVDKFTEFYEELKDREKLILPPDFFRAVKNAGMSLGIVTGRPKRDLEYVLKRFGLEGFFDAIVDEDDVVDKNLRKPHPFPLHLCMEALGAEEAIYVGDNRADLEMVKAYRKIYAKPVVFIHFRKVTDVDLPADFFTDNEEDLTSFLLKEAFQSPEGV